MRASKEINYLSLLCRFFERDQEIGELQKQNEGFVEIIQNLTQENKEMRELVEAMEEALQANMEEVNRLRKITEGKKENERIYESREISISKFTFYNKK